MKQLCREEGWEINRNVDSLNWILKHLTFLVYGDSWQLKLTVKSWHLNTWTAVEQLKKVTVDSWLTKIFFVSMVADTSKCIYWPMTLYIWSISHHTNKKYFLTNCQLSLFSTAQLLFKCSSVNFQLYNCTTVNFSCQLSP